MQQPVDADRVRGQRQRGLGEFDAVELVVGVGVGGADEGRYVAARLAGQEVVDVPERAAAVAGTGEGLVHVARSAVVGGDGQRPVLVEGVEVFQIAAGGARREDGIAPLVDERVDLQSVDLARCGHELPQTRCAHGGYGRRREGRFDDRQRAQLDRKTRLDELLFDQREVVLRHAEDAADRAGADVGVAVDVAFDDVVVGELHGRYEVAQPPDVDRVGRPVAGGGRRRVETDVGAEELLVGAEGLPLAPDGQQRVDLHGGEVHGEPVVVAGGVRCRFGPGSRRAGVRGGGGSGRGGRFGGLRLGSLLARAFVEGRGLRHAEREEQQEG